MDFGGWAEDLGSVERWSVWTAAVSSGLAGLLYLVGKVRQGVRYVRRSVRALLTRLDALDLLVTHELRPNSGSSLKDQVTRLLSHDVEQDRRLAALEASLATQAHAQTLIWPAIQAVAEAQPPNEGN